MSTDLPPLRPLLPCGTNAAYTRHLKHGEAPCAPCKAAHMDAGRAGKKARLRALSRLAQAHPEEYMRLLAAEQRAIRLAG